MSICICIVVYLCDLSAFMVSSKYSDSAWKTNLNKNHNLSDIVCMHLHVYNVQFMMLQEYVIISAATI